MLTDTHTCSSAALLFELKLFTHCKQTKALISLSDESRVPDSRGR